MHAWQDIKITVGIRDCAKTWVDDAIEEAYWGLLSKYNNNLANK